MSKLTSIEEKALDMQMAFYLQPDSKKAIAELCAKAAELEAEKAELVEALEKIVNVCDDFNPLKHDPLDFGRAVGVIAELAIVKHKDQD